MDVIDTIKCWRLWQNLSSASCLNLVVVHSWGKNNRLPHLVPRVITRLTWPHSSDVPIIPLQTRKEGDEIPTKEEEERDREIEREREKGKTDLDIIKDLKIEIKLVRNFVFCIFIHCSLFIIIFNIHASQRVVGICKGMQPKGYNIPVFPWIDFVFRQLPVSWLNERSWSWACDGWLSPWSTHASMDA